MVKWISVLEGLQHRSGLFLASPSRETGYDKAWIRDTVYASIAFERVNRERVRRAYHALLDVLLRHEYKIDHAIKERPIHAWQYIHARYDPETFNEFHEEWGNKQNDAIGLLLFKIGELERRGFRIIRCAHDLRIVQKLVHYLESVKYWEDRDNGVWEEWEELHASSIGACVAGLKQVKGLVKVPDHLIERGEVVLRRIVPRESDSKDVDLALLSLIYPFNVVNRETAETIVERVESELLRECGVIRYVGDQYYNEGEEAEWHFGLSWLSIVHNKLGNYDKAEQYLRKAVKLTVNGSAPELFVRGVPNKNTPLAWAQSMLIVAEQEFNRVKRGVVVSQ